MKKIEAYKAILATVDNCIAATHLDNSVDIRNNLKTLIQREEVSAEFGVEISSYYGYGSD